MKSLRESHIVLDPRGYPMNKDFPPEDVFKYPGSNGYADWRHEEVYCFFAVRHDNLRLVYKGVEYHFTTGADGCSQCKNDGWKSQIGKTYANENDLLKHFRFPDGKTIPEIIDELDDVEWM
jgi:hypothetical protein